MATSHPGERADQSADRSEHYTLRPEARPLYWQQMDRWQRRAFARTIASLREAVLELDRKRHSDSESRSSFFETSRYRGNQTIWLSGERGTGKTSLLYSIALSIVRAASWDAENRATGAASGADAKYPDVAVDLNAIRGRVVWLDPLEMDLLPGPTNLLATILTRIEAIVQRMGPARSETTAPRGLLDPHADMERAIIGLRKLMADVTVAWEGNLPQRGEHLDPDSFATEVIRAERARLGIPERFTRLLDQLAQADWCGLVKNPLFVLPVDDFDLNPSRCLELLRLIRMLQLPRLFTLILGDLSQTERVVQIKFTGDFAKVADMRLHPNVMRLPIHVVHKQLARDALRKLVPPAQRVFLKHMTVDEALQYRPYEQSSTLHDLLLKTELSLADYGELAIKNVLDFLTASPLRPATTTSRRPRYSVLQLFKAPPRVVVDLWYSLTEKRQRSKPLGVQAAIELCQEAIANDSTLSAEDQARLGDLFEADDRGDHSICLSGDLPKAHYVPGQRTSIAADRMEALEPSRLRLQSHGTWEILPSSARLRDPAPVPLSGVSASLLILAHDLVVLTSRHLDGSDMAPRSHSVPLASAIWTTGQSEVRIPWLAPPFQSFWEWDHFLDSWDHAEAIRHESLDRHAAAGAAQRHVEVLAFCWIAAGTNLLADAPESLVNLNLELFSNKSELPWGPLIAQLNLLAASVFDPESRQPRTGLRMTTRRRRVVEAWLCHIAVLLAPESGVPKSVADQFTTLNQASAPGTPKSGAAPSLSKQNPIVSFWLTEPHRTAIRRIRSKSYADFCSQGHSLLAVQLIAPNRRTEMERGRVQRAIKFLSDIHEMEGDEFFETVQPVRQKARKAKQMNAVLEKLKSKPDQWKRTDITALHSTLELIRGRLDGTEIRKRLGRRYGGGAAEKHIQGLRELERLDTAASHPINQLGGSALCPDAGDTASAIRAVRSDPSGPPAATEPQATSGASEFGPAAPGQF